MRMTYRHAIVALLVTASVTASAQVRQIYLCQKNPGSPSSPSTYQDFPCATGKGGPTGITSTTSASPKADPSPSSSRGFSNFEQYAAARDVCAALMSQYDFTAPMMRCQLEDTKCFSRANQESSEIFKRLTSLPRWKQQQCDLVMEMEGAAANDESGCTRTQITKPVPFLGTADEEIHLSDGSVWKDISYKYLYLYAYNPMVLICPTQAKMILDAGGQKHSFSLMRMR